MTILASFAQEESRSLSKNVKWAIRKGFKEGKTNSFCIYGYRYKNGVCEVVPEEAEVIRLIYRNYLNGISAEETAKQLDKMGIKSYTGLDKFSPTSIRTILRNERYTGVLLLQKTYIVGHITQQSKINKGEMPMYLVENAHRAIIDKITFQSVQAEYARRRELGAFANKAINTTVFTSIIKCGKCGLNFHRKGKKQPNNRAYKTWSCATKAQKGASGCSAKDIPENILKKISTEV